MSGFQSSLQILYVTQILCTSIMRVPSSTPDMHVRLNSDSKLGETERLDLTCVLVCIVRTVFSYNAILGNKLP